MGEAITQAKEQMAAAGLPTDQNSAAVYHDFNMKTQVMEFSAGFVVPDSAGNAPSSLTDWAIPSTDAFVVRHVGAYEHLGNGWSVANQHVRYRKMKQQKVGTFEVYRNCVDDVPAEELITDIYLPLK